MRCQSDSLERRLLWLKLLHGFSQSVHSYSRKVPHLDHDNLQIFDAVWFNILTPFQIKPELSSVHHPLISLGHNHTVPQQVKCVFPDTFVISLCQESFDGEINVLYCLLYGPSITHLHKDFC